MRFPEILREIRLLQFLIVYERLAASANFMPRFCFLYSAAELSEYLILRSDRFGRYVEIV